MTDSAPPAKPKNPLPKQDRIRIPVEKFAKYSLDPEKDPDKASAFWLALGYDLTNYNSLIDNIVANLSNFEAIPKGDIGYGMRYEVVMELLGANWKTANVLTAWIDDLSIGEMRLTNAYVDKKKGAKSND